MPTRLRQAILGPPAGQIVVQPDSVEMPLACGPRKNGQSSAELRDASESTAATEIKTGTKRQSRTVWQRGIKAVIGLAANSALTRRPTMGNPERISTVADTGVTPIIASLFLGNRRCGITS